MQKNVEEEEEVFVLMNNDGEKVFREKSTTIDGTQRGVLQGVLYCVYFFYFTRVSACHSERTRQCWIVDLSGTERSFLLRVS